MSDEILHYYGDLYSDTVRVTDKDGNFLGSITYCVDGLHYTGLGKYAQYSEKYLAVFFKELEDIYNIQKSRLDAIKKKDLNSSGWRKYTVFFSFMLFLFLGSFAVAAYDKTGNFSLQSTLEVFINYWEVLVINGFFIIGTVLLSRWSKTGIGVDKEILEDYIIQTNIMIEGAEKYVN